MTTNEYLRKTLRWHYAEALFGIDRIQNVRPRAACKDGFSVSIQAGKYLYCNPFQSKLSMNSCRNMEELLAKLRITL